MDLLWKQFRSHILTAFNRIIILSGLHCHLIVFLGGPAKFRRLLKLAHFEAIVRLQLRRLLIFAIRLFSRTSVAPSPQGRICGRRLQLSSAVWIS